MKEAPESRIAESRLDAAARPNGRDNLARLLREMMHHPERRLSIIEEIEAAFGQQKAVMVIDMSGFSSTTLRHGIVAFLLMIHQMKLLAAPCLEEHNGRLIKAEADDLICLFDSVQEAVVAGQEITRRLSAANVMLPEDRRLYVSIGIGFGQILNVADQDVFGSEVNLASKLGEDLGRMNDILLTAAARATLDDSSITCCEQQVSVSGIDLTYYSVDR